MINSTNDFLFHCKYEKNLSNKTIKAYKTDLKQFNLYLKNNCKITKVEEIDRETIKGFLKEISKYKPKTTLRKIASIKAMFNFMEYENEDFYNPFHRLKIKIKHTHELPTVMNLKEIKKLLKTAYDLRDKLFNSDTHKYKSIIRDIAVLELLFGTGIRVSELCNIKATDLDIHSKAILIRGKGQKERFVYICNTEILTSIKDYLSIFKDEISKSEFVFVNRLGRRLSEQSVRFMVKNYSSLAELSKAITPHTFRHTFATLLLEKDVDIKYIQHLLGHSSIMTTQIYTHVSKAKQKKLLTTKHPRHLFSFAE
ncbi:MAG: tyrosine-type recombinase/integrase [Bacteroidales bacterium]